MRGGTSFGLRAAGIVPAFPVKKLLTRNARTRAATARSARDGRELTGVSLPYDYGVAGGG